MKDQVKREVWKESGLAQKAFGERERFSYASLKYWSSRLLREKKLTLVPVRLATITSGEWVIRNARSWECVIPVGTDGQASRY